MDRTSIKFDWNRARAFLVTAEEGSLSAAARVLGMAQPTLGRQVTALEAELGVVLFERIGRGLTLTDSGRELLSEVQAMGDAANNISLKSLGQSQQIKGVVRIAISEVYAAFKLPPIIAKLRILQPDIHIEMVTSTDISDLLHREADIAIRNVRPTQPELISKKIADTPTHLYASPKYLSQIGHPKSAKDLVNADFIGVGDIDIMIKGLNEMGLSLTRNNFPIISKSWLVMWEFVKQGLGIGVLDGNIGDADPHVIRVLPDISPMLFPTWLVAHRELKTSARIRIVFDLLAQDF